MAIFLIIKHLPYLVFNVLITPYLDRPEDVVCAPLKFEEGFRTRTCRGFLIKSFCPSEDLVGESLNILKDFHVFNHLPRDLDRIPRSFEIFSTQGKSCHKGSPRLEKKI